jgi:hypothetical protein
MNGCTPPAGMLRELRDVDGLILELVAAPGRADWHWPSYYLLYVDVERMAWLVQRAGNVLAHGGADDDDEDAGAVRDAFGAVRDKLLQIVAQLWRMSGNLGTVIEDKALRRRIRAHFHPKSAWYQALHDDYCAGRLAEGGRVLERTILVLDPDPPERIEDLGAGDLLRRQRFAAGTPAARAALADAVRAAEQEHARTWTAMKDFFLAHCTLEDLLHPSSR